MEEGSFPDDSLCTGHVPAEVALDFSCNWSSGLLQAVLFQVSDLRTSKLLWPLNDSLSVSLLSQSNVEDSKGEQKGGGPIRSCRESHYNKEPGKGRT